MTDGPPHDRGVPVLPKPCATRIGQQPIRWCILPDGHIGDHEGVCPAEIPESDFGPKNKPRWG